MYRLFTFEEATDLLPTVERLLGNMQEAARELARVQGRAARLRPYSLELRNASQEMAFLLGQLQADKAELDRLGVHLKDMETGTVDFPTRLGAEVVCLSWQQGQDSITHYHRLGDSSRCPLPATSASNHG